MVLIVYLIKNLLCPYRLCGLIAYSGVRFEKVFSLKKKYDYLAR